MAARAPSGKQYAISLGNQQAIITEVGGGIRLYRAGSREIVESYAIEAPCDGAHGAVLVPWPNRIRGGRYSFGGSSYQLSLSEPLRGNAIHGLVRWTSWSYLDGGSSWVSLGVSIFPTPGYPFALDVAVTYALGDHGLSVETGLVNMGDTEAPYGLGFHPYLSPGSGLIDAASLRCPARSRLRTSPDDGFPIGIEPNVFGIGNMTGEQIVNDAVLDDTFGDLERDSAGLAWVHLLGNDGRSVSLWMDESFSYLQLYTGDTLSPPRRRHALAVEPMTCPPNSLQSSEGVLVLPPGASAFHRWGVGLEGSDS